MKPSRRLKIYIMSSFRNRAAVQLLTSHLADMGHEVMDWTRLAPPIPSGIPVEQRRRMFDGDEYGDIFTFCVEAVGSMDLGIYLGESGQDAGAEVGLAYGAGAPVIGLAGPLEAPGTIVSGMVKRWCEDVKTLLCAVECFAAGEGLR